MQSGTRIFAPFIFSRMNDMKSWFFFARLEADHVQLRLQRISAVFATDGIAEQPTLPGATAAAPLSVAGEIRK